MIHAFGSSGKSDQFVCGNWPCPLCKKLTALFADNVGIAKGSSLAIQVLHRKGFHTVHRSSKYWAGLWSDLVIEQMIMCSIKSRGRLTRGRGITETVRLQWIYSMHRCAAVHDAMTTATHIKPVSSEQHIDLSTSRCNRDFSDLGKIREWFNVHEPFDSENGDCDVCPQA